jgi:hypothetical protein
MLAGYRGHWPEGWPVVISLAGISAAVHGVISDHGQRAVGERIDTARSTLGDWGTDIRNWPADRLLVMADAYPEVRAAILDSIAGTAPIGRGGDATRDAFGVMVSGNRTMAALATDLADGSLSPAEARARLPELREHLAQVRRLILDAEAVALCGGQIGGRS